MQTQRGKQELAIPLKRELLHTTSADVNAMEEARACRSLHWELPSTKNLQTQWTRSEGSEQSTYMDDVCTV